MYIDSIGPRPRDRAREIKNEGYFMRKDRTALYAAAAICALSAALGCGGGSQNKLESAKAAEGGGNCREASALYAALALEAAPAHKLPDAQKGKIMQPALWQGEIEKYTAWLTDPAPVSVTLKTALDGLERCAPRSESDNTAQTAQPKPLDSIAAFAAIWNTAFNPPPPGSVDWDAAVKNAFGKKFSMLRLSAPVTYTYDVNIVSRKTSRRINFTLYPATPDSKSQITAPLPEGEYTLIIRSSVDFQKGQRWTSEYTAFPVTIGSSPALIGMDLKTKVVRKQD